MTPMSAGDRDLLNHIAKVPTSRAVASMTNGWDVNSPGWSASSAIRLKSAERNWFAMSLSATVAGSDRSELRSVRARSFRLSEMARTVKIAASASCHRVAAASARPT